MIPVTSKKKQLLALPFAPFDSAGWWDSLLIIPTKEKHDSGYAHIAIIGCQIDLATKTSMAHMILAYPDDITWPESQHNVWESRIRTDAYVENSALHLWSNYLDFSVSSATSSVDILTRKKVSA
jgi:hypothetical protein